MRETLQVGGCACGHVRYEIKPPSSWCAHCHCGTCRATHGAPFVTWLGVRAQRFRITQGADDLGAYESSEGTFRRFCRRCSTLLVMDSTAWFHQVHVVAATVDGGPHRKPAGHLFWEERAAWVTHDDALPRFGGPHGSRPLGAVTSQTDALNAVHPQVRLATRWDAPDVARLMSALAEVEWSSVPENLRAHVTQALEAAPDTFIFVAEHADQVVGFADIKRITATAEGATQLFIDDLYVAPDHRRRGLADALLTVIKAAAVQLGSVQVTLHLRPDNAPALALYESAGLTQETDTVMTWSPPAP